MTGLDSEKKILVLGANPAWQKTLYFRNFAYGDVNRSCRMETYPAGKGVNFCRAAKVWGRAVPELYQFTGGVNGDLLRDGLEREDLAAVSIPVAGATRCCTTCLDESTRTMTELIEPSHAVSEAEADRLLEAFKRGLAGASGAAVCGSLPDGSSYTIYHRAAALAHEAGVPILLDAWQNIEPCLTAGKNILKINRQELSKMTGISDLRAALKALFARFELQFAAITDGAECAYASDGKTLFEYTLMPLAEVVSPLGCGDTASAVLLSEAVAGTPFEYAFQLALGAASANCLNGTSGSFDRSTAAELSAGITVVSGEL